jgi:hypothetical protein
MWLLVLLFVAAQTADLLTWAQMDPSREMNPVVTTVGPVVALTAKLLVVAWTAVWCWHYRNAATTAVLLFGTAIGCFGAYTNL